MTGLEQDVIRRAAILVDAGQYGERRGASNPETCAAYLDLAAHGGDAGTTAWSKFAGRERGRLLELHRGSVKTDPRLLAPHARCGPRSCRFPLTRHPGAQPIARMRLAPQRG